MARGSAASFAGTGVLALLSSLAGGDFGLRGWVVVAAAVAAGLLAAVILFAYASLGRVGTHAIAVFGALLIGIVVGVERPSYGLLYVWLAFFVASFFRPRAVAWHVGWMLVCAGVAMSLGDPLQRPLESWLLLAGTLGGTSAFVCVVRRHLLDLAARERESRAVLDTVLRTAPVGFALFDRELRYLRVNDAYASWNGRTPDEHVGRRVDELFAGVGEQVEPAMRRVLETGEAVLDVEARHGDQICRSSRFPVRDGTGRITMIAALVDDVTELTRAQERLAAALHRERETRAFLDQLLEHAPLDFAFVDRDLVYRRINRRALESSQRPPEAILGRTVAEAYPELADQIEPALRRVLATGEPIVAEHMRTDSTSAGGERHWLVSRFPVRAADGTIVGVSSMRTEVTDLKRAKAQLAELLASEQRTSADVERARRILDERNRELAEEVRMDPLTQLANRRAFFEHAEAALVRARKAGSSVAALYVDLDDFKQINDTLGHAAGDELLRLVAERLHSLARPTDVVARLGGDEFLLLITDLDPVQGATHAVAVADRARDLLAGPFAVGDALVRVTASVGIGMSPADATDADTLVAAADAAMYSAKGTDPALVAGRIHRSRARGEPNVAA